jgi:hypothetical protein
MSFTHQEQVRGSRKEWRRLMSFTHQGQVRESRKEWRRLKNEGHNAGFELETSTLSKGKNSAKLPIRLIDLTQ